MTVYTGTAILTAEDTRIENLCRKMKEHLETEGWEIISSDFNPPEPVTTTPATHVKSTISYGPYILFHPYPTFNKLQMKFTSPAGAFPIWTTLTASADMPYWFVVNKRRFLLVVNVNGNYSFAYAGFYLSYSSPKYNPQPVMVAGNAGQNTPETSGSTLNPQYTSRVINGSVINGSAGLSFGYTQSNGINLDGSYNLFPWRFSSYGTIHELDGIFKVGGSSGLASEDIITVGADNYLVFQNFASTTDFYAIRLD